MGAGLLDAPVYQADNTITPPQETIHERRYYAYY